MLQGRVPAALRFIGSQQTALVPVNDKVIEDLKSKCGTPPSGKPVLACPLPRVLSQKVVFENIDGNIIYYKSSKNTSGATGSSGGIKTSIHAMLQMYEDSAPEGILLIDAITCTEGFGAVAGGDDAVRSCEVAMRPKAVHCWSSKVVGTLPEMVRTIVPKEFIQYCSTAPVRRYLRRQSQRAGVTRKFFPWFIEHSQCLVVLCMSSNLIVPP